MNARDLHENLRTSFSCINGVPRAYMEITIPIARPEPPHEVFIHHARFIYETVGVTMRGEQEAIEPILCAWFWQKLIGAFTQEVLEDHTVLIIFRRWPEVLSYIDGDGRECTKLTARFIISDQSLKQIFGEAVKEDGELLFRL